MKIGYTWRPWYWKARETPPAYLTAVHLPKAKANQAPSQQIGEYGFFRNPSAEYALIQPDGSGSLTLCRANSQGGWIDVECPAQDPGVLTVRENAWQGWYGWIDGKAARLVPGQWLQIRTPAGVHRYRFCYLPWNALLGGLMTLAGIALSVLLLHKAR